MAISGKFPPSALSRPASTYGYVGTGIAVVSIWASVVVSTIYAPDFVSGSQHEHLQLVGWVDWLWGALATGLVLLAALDGMRKRVTAGAPWMALGAGVSVVWLAVALVSVFAPVFVTGSDPTRIPLAALGVPIAGLLLTWSVCTFVRAVFEPRQPAG